MNLRSQLLYIISKCNDKLRITKIKGNRYFLNDRKFIQKTRKLRVNNLRKNLILIY